jgi:hypothetical protein
LVVLVTEIVVPVPAVLGAETEDTIKSGPILIDLDIVLLLSFVPSKTPLSASAFAMM